MPLAVESNNIIKSTSPMSIPSSPTHVATITLLTPDLKFSIVCACNLRLMNTSAVAFCPTNISAEAFFTDLLMCSHIFFALLRYSVKTITRLPRLVCRKLVRIIYNLFNLGWSVFVEVRTVNLSRSLVHTCEFTSYLFKLLSFSLSALLLNVIIAFSKLFIPCYVSYTLKDKRLIRIPSLLMLV